jgi:hypothetical protein
MTVTVVSLAIQAKRSLERAAGLDMAMVNGLVAITLLALAVVLIVDGARAWNNVPATAPTAPSPRRA